MTAEEELRQLKKELAAERVKTARLEGELVRERAENAHLRQMLEEVVRRLGEVEGQLAKDSHNSSKPPSSDGLGRKRASLRKRSEKKPGGQAGHVGHTLVAVETPDEVVRHRPVACQHCQHPLEEVAGRVKERRQVHDLPEMRLRVWEHQVEEVACPACGQASVGHFPTEVTAPVQYGPNVQALAVYLHQGQLVPMARTCEVLDEVCGCHLSQGTLLRWVQEASERLVATVEKIADWLSVGGVQHGDETGVRITGKLHWLHVNCTEWLTHLAWHQKRGRQAMDEIGIWPRFGGRAMHDRWASYDHYAGAHSLCGAHLVRDCTYLAEQDQQTWAAEMAEHLLAMHHAAHEWRLGGATCVPRMERDEWVTRYFEILVSGYAAQPPPVEAAASQRRGRQKQSAAKHLLDALLRRADQVLVFLDDLSLPFTNNQAERDLRMVKVQQKIAGTFRSDVGATAFCRIRSYLSTMHKQGHSMLAALAAVFAGQPLPVAWAPV
jgi:transposase